MVMKGITTLELVIRVTGVLGARDGGSGELQKIGSRKQEAGTSSRE
jgi:hypothetical protein